MTESTLASAARELIAAAAAYCDWDLDDSEDRALARGVLSSRLAHARTSYVRDQARAAGFVGAIGPSKEAAIRALSDAVIADLRKGV